MKHLKLGLAVIACVLSLFPPVSYKPSFQSTGNPGLWIRSPYHLLMKSKPGVDQHQTGTRLAHISNSFLPLATEKISPLEDC